MHFAVIYVKARIGRRMRYEVYNLAFGGIDENGETDDYSASDNGDRNKILATVLVRRKYTRVLLPGSQ